MKRGSFTIPNKAWKRYENIINSFINKDAGRQSFLWLRKVNQLLQYGEDSGVVYQPYAMEGLFHYNYILTWPTQNQTVSGDLNNSNQVLYISAELLGRNNLLKNGYWDFNWADDKFVVNGQVFSVGQDTQVAQSKDKALLFFVVLRREDPEEAIKILDSYGTPESQVVTPEGIWIIDKKGVKLRDLASDPLRVPPGSKFIPSNYIEQF